MEKDVGHKLPSVKLFKGNAKLGMDVFGVWILEPWNSF